VLHENNDATRRTLVRAGVTFFDALPGERRTAKALRHEESTKQSIIKKNKRGVADLRVV
jgi:hypothetical protein